MSTKYQSISTIFIYPSSNDDRLQASEKMLKSKAYYQSDCSGNPTPKKDMREKINNDIRNSPAGIS